MNSLSLVSCLALVVVLLVAGCVSSPPEEKIRWTIPSDKYVFIDHHVSRDGELISGSCGGLMIDFPMYSFDRATKELSGMSARELVVNESLKIVYGDGMSLGGALGGGASTYLTPVYVLPFEKDQVTIRDVTSDGTAIITTAGGTITLPAGETWKNVSVITESGELPGSDGACSIRVTRTETIYNAGIVDKSLIKRE